MGYLRGGHASRQIERPCSHPKNRQHNPGQGGGFMDINQDRIGWPSDLLDPETKTCRNEEKDQG